MQNETRQCHNCKKDFTVDLEDFNFYEKIQIPAPTFCPDCRLIRRLAWRNDFAFYNRKCDLCGRNIISLYHKDKPLTVYCNKCWWGDSWDPKSYGKEIDFSRPFFEQFRELQNVVPLLTLINDDGVMSVNCEYTQNVTFAKNCYMLSMSWHGEDCMYSYAVAGPETRYVIDSLNIFFYSQFIYDSIFLEHCYNCRNCYYSTGLADCSFCYDCKGCSNCFGCVNLRQKKFCIWNIQYTKDEYEEKIKNYQLDTYSGTENVKKEFLDFILKYPHRFASIRNSVNCVGDGLFNCKNAKDSFWARGCDDVRYLLRSNDVKDSYDITPGGESSQCYEALTADHNYRGFFTIFSFKNQEVTYVENCHSSKHLFGCAGIKHGQYCILNKEYSKEEYFKLRDKLIEHMKKTGEYGEFFPSELSNFGYNETVAQEHFPISKEEAIKNGFKWWNRLQKTTGKETMKTEQIPDSILDVKDDILNEVFSCIECNRNYKIVPDELNFYKKHSIPLPRKCLYCRKTWRLKFENPFHLWHRQCMCSNENHDHVGQCQNEFETPYAPERPETVDCEDCYNREVY